MKKKMKKAAKSQGKQAQRFKKAKKPQRKESHGIPEDTPVKKSPDVDRLVDDILLKYNDFGLTDRD